MGAKVVRVSAMAAALAGVWVAWASVWAEAGQRPAPLVEEGQSPAPSGDRKVVIASRMVAPDGTLAENVAIVISGGRIERLAPAQEFEGDIAAYRVDGVVSPGLIDLVSSLGVAGEDASATHAVDPDLSIVEAFDPGSRDLERALREGVTAAMIAPRVTNLVNGTTAVVRTWTDRPEDAVLVERGDLIVGLGPGTLSTGRPPTSRAGAVELLRRVLREESGRGPARRAEAGRRPAPLGSEAGRGSAPLNQSPIAEALDGRRGVLVFAPEAQDVGTARRVLGEFGVRPTLVHADELLDVAEELAADGSDAAGSVVIVGPYTFSTDERVLMGAAALSGHGVRFAFAGGMPSDLPQPRATASIAVRYGLDPASARRAMTSEAARIAGVGDRIGSIAPGMDADLVFFTGDPLRLDSGVREVWVRGERVYLSPAWLDDGQTMDADSDEAGEGAGDDPGDDGDGAARGGRDR
jgi:imidazolonepropionase-like amidohydrolase